MSPQQSPLLLCLLKIQKAHYGSSHRASFKQFLSMIICWWGRLALQIICWTLIRSLTYRHKSIGLLVRERERERVQNANYLIILILPLRWILSWLPSSLSGSRLTRLNYNKTAPKIWSSCWRASRGNTQRGMMHCHPLDVSVSSFSQWHGLARVLFMCVESHRACVFQSICAGFQHMFWTERVMALFTPHYPGNKWCCEWANRW